MALEDDILKQMAEGSKQLTAIPEDKRGILNESEMATEIAKLFEANQATAEKVVQEINELMQKIAEKENDEINALVQSANKRTDGKVHDLDQDGKSTVSLNEPDSVLKYSKILEQRAESNRFWGQYGLARREINDELQEGIARIFKMAHQGLRQNKPIDDTKKGN